MRALVSCIQSNIDDEALAALGVPNALPLVYEFSANGALREAEEHARQEAADHAPVVVADKLPKDGVVAADDEKGLLVVPVVLRLL